MKQILAVACTLFFAVAFGENVSVSLLSREFFNGVNTMKGPDRLAVNVPTYNFAHEFTISTGNLLNDFILEYYRQARLTSITVVNDWKSSTKKLLRKLSEVPENNSEYLDTYMNKVSKCINQFLLMEPGNLETREEEKFPELPKAGPILTHFNNYEPNKLFHNLEKMIDQDISSIYNLAQQIFLTGWQNARLSLAKVQKQFQNEFLHCTLLAFWIEQTNKIEAASELLRKHVRTESWNNYKELSERVEQIRMTIRLDQEFCQSY